MMYQLVASEPWVEITTIYYRIQSEIVRKVKGNCSTKESLHGVSVEVGVAAHTVCGHKSHSECEGTCIAGSWMITSNSFSLYFERDLLCAWWHSYIHCRDLTHNCTWWYMHIVNNYYKLNDSALQLCCLMVSERICGKLFIYFLIEGSYGTVLSREHKYRCWF